MKSVVTVLVTGAAGQIAYSLIPLIGNGYLLGKNQKIALHLLDIPAMAKNLVGLRMEIEDMALPLLTEVITTSDESVAFKNVDVALLIGARPRAPGMERKDLLKANAAIFKAQGNALDKYASKDVKVVVVGNPANTNAAILSACAPSIPARNITALTRLDQNRAQAQIAKRVGTSINDVQHIIIWGNHSATQYPDWHHAKIVSKRQDVASAVNDDKWLQTTFVKDVQVRGAKVLEARKLSSAMSAAKAVSDHVHDWILGTPVGRVVSMVVPSDGSYNIPKGLMYSFPVVCTAGNWEIQQGLPINEFSRRMMDATAQELIEEQAMAFEFVGASRL